jgi:hypothetical protein
MNSGYFDKSFAARTLVCMSEAKVPVNWRQVTGCLTRADEGMHEMHIDVEMGA